MEQLTQTAADAVKQLVENKNLALDFQKKLQKLDKKKFKDAVESSKNMVKKNRFSGRFIHRKRR